MLELAFDEAFFIASLLWWQMIETGTKTETLECPSCISLLTEIPGHSWINGLGKTFMIGELFYSLTKLIHHRYMVVLHECCKLEISLVFSVVLICVRLWASAHV